MDEDYSSNSSSLEERNKKFRFGIRSLSPDWLQVFRHPIAFTTILFLCGVVEGAIVSGERAIPCFVYIKLICRSMYRNL